MQLIQVDAGEPVALVQAALMNIAIAMFLMDLAPAQSPLCLVPLEALLRYLLQHLLTRVAT
jgi:hypothetical protein